MPDDPSQARAALATMGLADLDAFIEQASDPRTPLAVFLAALDRYTALTTAARRTVPQDEAAPHDRTARPANAAQHEKTAAQRKTAPEGKLAPQKKPADA